MAESGAVTLEEEIDISGKWFELRESGKTEEARALAKTLPVAPDVAKIYARLLGAESARNCGRDVFLEDMAGSAAAINCGRRGFNTPGMTEKSFLVLEKALAMARRLFNDAIASGDPELMLAAEYLYTAEEIAEAARLIPDYVRKSRANIIGKFEDALRALSVVRQGDAYRAVALAFPRGKGHRYDKAGKLPKDSFHHAMIYEAARLKKALSAGGSIRKADEDISRTRLSLYTAAQNAYAGLQRTALGLSGQEA